ncbi:MAG: filamentous hemagglutinin N-terminal domain-containing protein [Xenococcaceae cyanobacterium MO_167.B27]|nr:filamentous hemagglutinin N-terminal domain-containing protein [Xenococcaceae cyanobacterium MO_167.B27]
MNFSQQFCLIGGITLCPFFSLGIAQAQIIPDGTTPNTNITGDCLIRCDITGGIQADSNLFHSFQEFNVGFKESVYFVDPGVANIFSRVTGGNISEIFGTLGVRGDANLWLLNPNGIIFGRGATLDINGSFVATTADAIKFGERGFFAASADSPENLPLLTVKPSAFFYHQMGQGNPITVTQGASLTVPNQENLVLLGAQQTDTIEGVAISGGSIQASQGRVEIGAVEDTATIGINSEFQLQFSETTTRGNITLSQGGAIDVTGFGGSIAIYGREVNIIDNSSITSTTLGNVDGGKIDIAAQQLKIDDGGVISSFSFAEGKGADIFVTAESIDISGTGREIYQELITQAINGELAPSSTIPGIVTASGSLGDAGNITIDSKNISVIDGGFIASVTYNQGKAGNIDVTNSETINLSSSGFFSFSAAGSVGDTGDLKVKTGQLTLRDGSIISATTLGAGKGGDILIQASESVELLETPEDYILPTAIFTDSLSQDAVDAGNITIDTQRLVIKDGSQVSSAIGFLNSDTTPSSSGKGGDIKINASDSVTVSGNSPDGTIPSAVFSNTRNNNPAGNIRIDTGTLSLEGQALISASSFDTGEGGDLTINASESVQLSGTGLENILNLFQTAVSGEPNLVIVNVRGGLFTTTKDGQGGNLEINTPILNVKDGALISTTTVGLGDGGNLNIEAAQKVEIESSALVTAAVDGGDAGNIEINTEDLMIYNRGFISTSTIGSGEAGDVSINATNSIEFFDNNPEPIDPLLPGGITTSNAGETATSPGDLTLNTKNLIIRDGVRIRVLNEKPLERPQQTNNLATQSTENSPGNITINASESIKISGALSGIASTTHTNRPASNIKITTPQLFVLDGADISVDSTDSGAAGSLEIVADELYLDNGGKLNASTSSGQGGNISLKIKNILQLEEQAAITTNAEKHGNGGNIKIIDTNWLIVFPGSQITATAANGDGGNITISANHLLISPHSETSASSQDGMDGEVKIETFTSNLSGNLVKLPEKLLNAENSISSSCGGNNNFQDNNFVYVGKGGLPPNPLEDNSSDNQFLSDLGASQNPNNAIEFSLQTIDQSQNTPIVEAKAWFISDRGTIVLTAAKPDDNRQSATKDSISCPFGDG